MKRAFFLSLIIHISIFSLFFYVFEKEAIKSSRKNIVKTTLNLENITIKQKRPKRKIKSQQKHIIKPKIKPKSRTKRKHIVKHKKIPKIEHRFKPKNIVKSKKKYKPKPKLLKKPKTATQQKIKPITKPKKDIQEKKAAQIKKSNFKQHSNTPIGKKIEEHRVSQKEFNRFLSEIRDYINRFKHYPRIARMLHKQGVVEVEFKLEQNGDIKDIKIIKSAGKILDRAALKCIKKASSYFPKPKSEIDIKVPLEYKLKD